MAHAKDTHYWTQLRAALTGGLWTSDAPAKTPKGAPLSWPNLLRKFNKHCNGFADIAQIASQTQALALLLGADSQGEDDDGSGVTSFGSLALGNECMLQEERMEEARVGYETLKNLESFNCDSALAYYAYALGMPSECLSFILKIPNLPDIPTAEIKDGRAWAMTEALRSLCLQGMCHERFSPTEPEIALKSYRTALPLLTIVETEISAVVPSSLPVGYTSGAGKPDFSSFTRFRELWRWAERLIRRAVILTSKTINVHEEGTRGSLWTWLSHYTSCSAHWPPTFRTQHRSTICVLHLQALISRATTSSARKSSVRVVLRPQDPRKPPDWVHAARNVVQEYRAILTVSTSFPRAGERNVKVEDFVDLCVAVWEASGEIGDYAGWVIDILWWATRLTFNCHRIFRHMTRLLYVSGDTELAKRTLRLYVQVVSKARVSGGEADSDRHWVETLVQGARMLCRFAVASPGLGGIKDAREALDLIAKAQERLDLQDKEQSASVDLAEGICSLTLGLKEQDSRTRPERFSRSHKLFLQSVESFPTSAGYYHLALSFARAGPSQDLDQAIAHLESALVSEPGEVRYWHALGLFLAAMEQWKAAVGALEQGAGIGEIELVEEITENGIDRGSLAQGGATAQSRGSFDSVHRGKGSQEACFLLDLDAERIASSESLLRPLLDHPPPSRQEVFEHALQLRMTQVAVAEHVEGPEGAVDRWVDVFSWISEKRGVGIEQRSNTMNGSNLGDIKEPSELHLPPPLGTGEPGSAASTVDHSTLHPQLPVPPIEVTPATPDEPTQISPFRSPPEKLPTIEEKVLPIPPSTEKDTSKGKKVQQMLKNRIHKGRVGVTAISKKIGHGMQARTGGLRRSNSAPDFYSVLRTTHYQASSIHSRRRRLGSFIHPHEHKPVVESPPPPPPVAITAPQQQMTKGNSRVAKDNRLFSDLWLMSAATFRRSGKIEQAKGAIQEAEVRDEGNPSVWVQLGLYHVALGQVPYAIDAFQKALFISPDDLEATVYLCRLYLSPSPPSSNQAKKKTDSNLNKDNVDLAAGMLSYLSQGAGYDVPEVWYFLAKAYGLQERKDKERECLGTALGLAERRGVRDVGIAVGWFL